MIADAARKAGKDSYPVYLEVNVGSEAQKHGAPIGEAENLAALIAKDLPQLVVQGVMAIPPASLEDPPSLTRTLPTQYMILSRLAQKIGMGKLSLGMSNDLATAIGAGSTMIRVGRALFGDRA